MLHFISLNLKKKANHIFFIANFSKLFINIYYGYYENCFFFIIFFKFSLIFEMKIESREFLSGILGTFLNKYLNVCIL